MDFTIGKDFIETKRQGVYLRVEAWSKNAIRVRATLEKEFKPFDWSICKKQRNLPVSVQQNEDGACLTNGKIKVQLSNVTQAHNDWPETPLTFYNAETGKELLRERRARAVMPSMGHILKSVGPSTFRAEACFEADEDEAFWGLGHNQHNLFDLKGSAIELQHKNSQTAIPVIYSSKGYGFFWNNPAIGRVELVNNGTYWLAEETDQLDYFVYTDDTPAQIMNCYAELTGYPSMMPDWALGFWQCKLRYRNRNELMEVARKHIKELGLPMSVIVIDFFHWAIQGEWDFDPACWPDPEEMLAELKEMGIQTMVSIWPTVNPNSRYFDEMLEKAYMIRTENGLATMMRFTDTYDKKQYLHYVDFTNPDAGKFVWEIVRKNYYDKGVRLFWLDECEPEVRPYHYNNLRYYIGNGGKYSSLYPLFEEKTFYEGMKEAGEELPINLCRSAWAGSQKYGACVWSGDIYSNFATLEEQIKTGLNMAMSGIPWWTTDIGGFFGGKVKDPEFRELIVRWFQWGVFCPVFRLHGFRDSDDVKNAGENEVWSFGEEAYEIIKALLFMREALRPYVKAQMELAHETGVPPMRPLFFDFPEDEKSYTISDELLFGPDILVAPIYKYKQRSREVYLPEGADWYDVVTGEKKSGGTIVNCEALLGRIPIFTKNKKKFW